jgi:hypothetical protein
MSAFGGIADIGACPLFTQSRNVRFVPKADIVVIRDIFQGEAGQLRMLL